ncbi:hypothetical protein [Vibrio cholerae]|uniref:hypothetical protein n=1 Tax=Vibrio cholerae TaxID=666 RepID=UPI0037C22E16
MSDKPFYRHQVHEIPPPRIVLTEYRLYSGKCTQCGEAVKAQNQATSSRDYGTKSNESYRHTGWSIPS